MQVSVFDSGTIVFWIWVVAGCIASWLYGKQYGKGSLLVFCTGFLLLPITLYSYMVSKKK